MGVSFCCSTRKQEEVHDEYNELLRYYEMDYLIRGNSRHNDGLCFPTNYHNSFWSNYYCHYWDPSSHYYSSLNTPDPVPLLPGFYQYYDPRLPKSEASVSIQKRSRYFYNTMSLYNSHPMITM